MIINGFLCCFLASTHYNIDVKGVCKNKANSCKKFIGEIKEPEYISCPVEIESVPQFEKLNTL